MTTVIFKTHSDTLQGVIENMKHALSVQPRRLSPGDTILIAETVPTRQPGRKQIRYRMTFVNCYLDERNLTDQIWKRHWKYVIDGKELAKLRNPFNPDELPLSKNYGQGGTIAYLEPCDEEALRKAGFLEVGGNQQG